LNYDEHYDDWGSIPGGGKDFSLYHSVHTSNGAHPAASPVGTVSGNGA